MLEVAIGAGCGAILGLVFDLLAVRFFLLLARTPSSWAAGALRGRSLLTVLVPPALLFHSLWTLLGLLLGLAYHLATRSGSPGGMLGSPNSPFTAGIIGFAGIAVVLSFLVARRYLAWALVFSVFFVGLFGWMLPLLSERLNA
ncbi:MAG: hypothetical protein HYY31_05810 [Chloroflexi bacterium]|nr:hypothetical protein [Chloroflexota bacterium]